MAGSEQDANVEEAHARLPADLGIAGAAALRDELLALRDSEAALRIDGSAVERVSTACLQVLLALFRDRAAGGRRTVLEPVSEPLAEAARWLGLDPHFDLSPRPEPQQA